MSFVRYIVFLEFISIPLSEPSADLHSVGILSCLDGYMNIALEQTEEHVNGVVTNRYGDAFIRGNNGMSMFI